MSEQEVGLAHQRHLMAQRQAQQALVMDAYLQRLQEAALFPMIWQRVLETVD